MEMNTTFSMIIAAGAGLGLYQVFRLAPARHALNFLDAAILILFAALLEARGIYIGINWAYFAEKPVTAMMIGNGGLMWQGAVAGGLLALLWISIGFHTSLAALADAVAPLLPPVTVAAWLGCWLAGCGCAGAVSGSFWWAVPAPDATGLVAARFPLQPAAALLLALEFLLAQVLTGPRSRPGMLAARFWLALGLNLLFFSFYTDSIGQNSGLRFSTWSAAVLVLLSLAGMLAAWLHGRQRPLPYSSRKPGERPVDSRT